eukprot:944794-Ditylum_brightwellii.AAC.1
MDKTKHDGDYGRGMGFDAMLDGASDSEKSDKSKKDKNKKSMRVCCFCGKNGHSTTRSKHCGKNDEYINLQKAETEWRKTHQLQMMKPKIQMNLIYWIN